MAALSNLNLSHSVHKQKLYKEDTLNFDVNDIGYNEC